jgi:general secretion pathway protein G
MEQSQKLKNRLDTAFVKRQQGMTLIEIMVVVIIMAIIATGVGVAVMPRLKKARIDTAKTDAAALRTAVQLFLAENGGKCPTVDDLKAGKYLDKTKRTTDPWDKDFVINCIEDDDPEVFSLGPDGQEGGCDPGKAEDGCSEGGGGGE